MLIDLLLFLLLIFIMDFCLGEWNIELSLIYNNVKDIDIILLMICFGKYVWFFNGNILNIDE